MRKPQLALALPLVVFVGCSAPAEDAGRGGDTTSTGNGPDGEQFIEPSAPGDGAFVGDDEQLVTGELPPTQLGMGDLVEKPTCQGNCEDVPAAPFIVEGTAVDAADPAAGFATPSGSGVCLLEPANEALMPANWSPPLFEWSGSDTLWEITIESPQQRNALKAYTTDTSYLFPPEVWFPFAENNDNNDVTVTIRGKSGISSTTKFYIAPVRATGSMVYAVLSCIDSQDPTCSLLDGFNVGDVNTVEALTPAAIDPEYVLRDEGGNLKPDRPVRCIGCHTSTPGGNEVAFTDSWPWTNSVTSIVDGEAGKRPDYLTEAGSALAGQPWMGIQTFSEAHWAAGDRIVIASYGAGLMELPPEGQTQGQMLNVPYRTMGESRGSNQPLAELAWIDLEAPTPTEFPMSGWETGEALAQLLGTSWGFLTREGDTRGAMAPDWSNQGDRVVYVSTDCGKDGRLGCGKDSSPPSGDTEADLYTVPYADRQGGAATKLDGASEPGVWEYYPAFSPDDKFIAFNRVADYANVKTPDNEAAAMYYNPASEIWLVPSAGGEATRLAANDPAAACGSKGVTSPGAYNSWPKWSPRAVTTPEGDTYYWLIIQSARDPEDTFDFQGQFRLKGPNSKLYLAGVVVRDGQIVKTSPALDIWFQRRTVEVAGQSRRTNNLTPAWDTFPIPPPPTIPRVKLK